MNPHTSAPAKTAGRQRRLAAVARWIALIVCLAHAHGAPAADPPAGATPTMEGVTVEGRRHLEQEASHYVRSVLVHEMYDSLVRWNVQVCPLVAGLPKDKGEFILWRISQVANAAHAPLGGEHCQANLFVIVTPEPDLLLSRWWRRNPRLYDITDGMGHVKGFLHDPRPIRGWYNVAFTDSDGGPASAASVAALSDNIFIDVPVITGRVGSRLHYTAVRELSSVIIVADERRISQLNIGQVSDYVAMIALAQVRPDADIADTPSILKLFREPASPPQGLSAWDQALLYGLYNTGQRSVLQSSAIVTRMMERIASSQDGPR
jgi:hypothetical protein